MTGPLHAPPDDLPPTATVGGRYHIERRLGEGGMATVDLAMDLELHREVALKRLHPHLVTDAMVDRFRREARAAARLRHPGVVTVHDWGFDGDTPYLVMELVEGPSLRTALERRGRLAPGEALAVLAPAVAGLAAAHRAGLVHRDVTPGNVLVGPDGASKMADFGLARPVASATVTVPDAVVGSPHYLSPEAARGEPLDARSDVFSLGCVLYECLTGHPPFEGGTAAVIATARLSERVEPPSRHVRRGLPPGLDEVVLIATEPDPDDRYEDADDLLADLRDAVPGGPVPVDLRDGSDHTVVIPQHATRVLDEFDDEHDDGGRRRGRFRRLLGWLLVLGLLGGGGWLAFDRVIAPVTAVPQVLSLPASEARAALEDAGFRVRVAREREFDREVPEGAVVAQSTTSPTRQLSEITLVLSAGPRMGTLPPLVGRDVTAARAAIEELGLDLTVSTTVGYDDELPPGTVLTATPDGGATVAEGSEVALTVSDGPAPVELPDLTGERQGAVNAELVGLGLATRVTERRYDPAPEGTVIATDPPPGSTLRRGDEVGLTVSDGPEPVEVPKVEGMREAEAVRRLEDAGFTVDVRYVTTLLPLARGVVDEQDPDPGTTRPRGDTVRIFVWQ